MSINGDSEVEIVEISSDDRTLVDILQRRFAARRAKDYPTADKLRDELINTFSVDLNDRANTWKDACGRVGTQDGPTLKDYFEDRGKRLQEERKERKKLKEQAKATRRAAEKEEIGSTVGEQGFCADTPRDPNAFVQWLRSNDGPLKRSKPYAAHPQLAERCIDIIERWRLRFSKQIWLRLLGGGSRAGMQQRLVKELLESLHVIARVMQHVERDLSEEHTHPITVLDLCSGFGYLSMFLAELLPPAIVEKIVLLDKAWPMHSQEGTTSGQINAQHVFHEGWPIRLTTCKNNLKSPAGRRSIHTHVLQRAQGAVIILGIHLCGQLSVRAVELFNAHPQATMLALKPCCLPQVWAGMPMVVWTFANGETVSLEHVGIKGRFVKNVWRGPPRAAVAVKFESWAARLFAGIASRRKESEEVDLWDYGGHHFQNRFLWGYKGIDASTSQVVANSEVLKDTTPEVFKGAANLEDFDYGRG